MLEQRELKSVDKISEDTQLRYEEIYCSSHFKKVFLNFFYNEDEPEEKERKEKLEKERKELIEKEKQKEIEEEKEQQRELEREKKIREKEKERKERMKKIIIIIILIKGKYQILPRMKIFQEKK